MNIFDPDESRTLLELINVSKDVCCRVYHVGKHASFSERLSGAKEIMNYIKEICRLLKQ